MKQMVSAPLGSVEPGIHALAMKPLAPQIQQIFRSESLFPTECKESLSACRPAPLVVDGKFSRQ